GTLLLVWDAPWSRASLEVVVVLALVGLCVTLAAPLDFAQLPGPAVASGVAFPAIASSGFLTPRAWTIPFNTWGTLWMVGGAAWSAWRLREKRPPRAFGTAVIAVSGLVLAGTSVLNRFGIPGLEGLGRTLGVALLFLGFSASSWREWPAWAAGAWPSVRRYGPAGLVAVAVLAALGWAFPGLAGAVLANPGLAVVAIVVLFMIGAVVQAARHPRRVRQH
ncbi:MAG TPA: hypothetical protein VHN99_05700, partial [Deinococcales bacterium]|nr:hypothetical protein [Deinococcales bacterium]